MEFKLGWKKLAFTYLFVHATYVDILLEVSTWEAHQKQWVTSSLLTLQT